MKEKPRFKLLQEFEDCNIKGVILGIREGEYYGEDCYFYLIPCYDRSYPEEGEPNLDVKWVPEIEFEKYLLNN